MRATANARGTNDHSHGCTCGRGGNAHAGAIRCSNSFADAHGHAYLRTPTGLADPDASCRTDRAAIPLGRADSAFTCRADCDARSAGRDADVAALPARPDD